MPHYETQYTRILDHLEKYGRISPLEAMERYGIQRLAARISVLKKQGYRFATETTAGRNRYGDKVHFTTYILEGGPEGEAAGA